ncbi:hypothetical protein K431DRAFT_305364 [Polychaeton citri CBS 116435]|uniref:Uncharacterized protein n=1 Tax=Polychaeton citri CBS 116435 TaxID=1314669 RepID=A0A9P4UM47_9PEZI|nr:hypothetical protein K431DRAFT_305364 [Polychaeton citri CBS 116435]
MSNQSSSTFTSYSYSSSSSSSNNNGNVTGSRQTEQSFTDPSGTKVTSATQNMGEPIIQESREYDSQGRELLTGSGSTGDNNRRIEDVTDVEQERRDREYEERIEEEYAKREGGA